MAIDAQLNQWGGGGGGDMAFQFDSAPVFDPFHFNLQMENQILLHQQIPQKSCHKLLHNQPQWIPTPQNIDLRSVHSAAEMQTHQMNHCLISQSEKLRSALQKKRNQQLESLTKKIESRIRILFREKDEEIALAKKRRTELEGFLMQLQMENQERQRAVQESEAVVASLKHALQEMREKLPYNGADDAESVNGEEDAMDDRKKAMICRVCNCRISSVLFWPCRHLSSCKPCEKILDSCPICNTEKKACVDDVIF